MITCEKEYQQAVRDTLKQVEYGNGVLRLFLESATDPLEQRIRFLKPHGHSEEVHV